MLTLRLFCYDEADYAAYVKIDNAVFPVYKMTADIWRHIDGNRPKMLPFERYFILRDGVIVGVGSLGQKAMNLLPDKYNMNLLVAPAHEASDIRPFFLDYALGWLAARDARILYCGMLNDHTIDVDFLSTHGFSEVLREQLSELDLPSFDPAPFEDVLSRVAASGIRILSLAELPAIDPDWQRKLYECHEALMADVPSMNAYEPDSFERFVNRNLAGDPTFTAEGWLVALDGNRIVGMSHFGLNEADDSQLDGGLTGVLRNYRRRGIATALKVRLLTFAKSLGKSRLTTGNEESNPMYGINVALGFAPKPAFVIFEKTLAS